MFKVSNDFCNAHIGMFDATSHVNKCDSIAFFAELLCIVTQFGY